MLKKRYGVSDSGHPPLPCLQTDATCPTAQTVAFQLTNL